MTYVSFCLFLFLPASNPQDQGQTEPDNVNNSAELDSPPKPTVD